MRKKLVPLLVGTLAMGLLPAAATESDQPGDRVDKVSNVNAEVSALQADDTPPRPLLRSHGERIRAAQIGFCTREQVESEHGCGFPDVFKSTRKLPVHPRGHVFINTRVDATDVSVNLFCGSAGPVWQLNDRRWVFHVSRKQGRRGSCDGGSIHITYGEGTGFDGGVARYTFSTKPHRH